MPGELRQRGDEVVNFIETKNEQIKRLAFQYSDRIHQIIPFVLGIDKARYANDKPEFVTNSDWWPNYIRGEPIDPEQLTHKMNDEDWFKMLDIIANDPENFTIIDEQTAKLLKWRKKIMDMRNDWAKVMHKSVQRYMKAWGGWIIPRRYKKKVVNVMRQAAFDVFKMVGPKSMYITLYPHTLKRYFNGFIYDIVFDPILCTISGCSMVLSPKIPNWQPFAIDTMKSLHYFFDRFNYEFNNYVYKRCKKLLVVDRVYYRTRKNKEGLLRPGEPPTYYPIESEAGEFLYHRFAVQLFNLRNNIFTEWYYNILKTTYENVLRLVEEENWYMNLTYGHEYDYFTVKDFYEHDDTFDLKTRLLTIPLFLTRGYFVDYIYATNPVYLMREFDALLEDIPGARSLLDLPFGPEAAQYYEDLK